MNITEHLLHVVAELTISVNAELIQRLHSALILWGLKLHTVRSYGDSLAFTEDDPGCPFE